ncbi:MAG: chromosomal replication initiator protein DnaA [Gammaproteobacteria bacterium]|nr:chromosomal replication initiator protein DnaA [Gammaproteobacteria bacterium]MBT8050931.1 chromosomal replication initiator protein DnaA [Gammaproteobacteria bacterium]MBT8057295.1 chromosomal replication initiator protein DnaA [Gammaproteobacteria bacterium]NNJ78659.1 chromosomal replication initiator protein DnaA [Xanthomonadales bacterium]
MSKKHWKTCVGHLERELPADDFNIWILPLQTRSSKGRTVIQSPNEYVRDYIAMNYLERIRDIYEHLGAPRDSIIVDVSSGQDAVSKTAPVVSRAPLKTGLDKRYHFDNFVQGKSNELAYAAAQQVAAKPGAAYNPLLFYGGTGLGKTHLLHAAGNLIHEHRPESRVIYLHSEHFVSEMIKALRSNSIEAFKQHYRTADALLIDDIQFFAGKDRSQEEFFHTFNALLDSQQQIILTCDRYPKEVDGIEARLRSRFGWGLTVSIEPPDFETRVAILLNKTQERGMNLSDKVAFLIAKRIRSNVRDLEGALNTLFANARFSGKEITVAYAQEVLRDLLLVHDRLITIENIQKEVCEYYKMRVSELLSRRRTRTIARPRQMAMALSKELTEHSLPEIGEAFGGRDHTTVLHACRKIEELCETDGRIREDRAKLVRKLTS